MVRHDSNRHQKSMERILEVGSGGQCPPGGQPHNLATWFHPLTTTALNRFRTSGETQTAFHIVESCPLTQLNSGLSQIHSDDDAAIACLTKYGS